jgi:hypothetical protein
MLVFVNSRLGLISIVIVVVGAVAVVIFVVLG